MSRLWLAVLVVGCAAGTTLGAGLVGASLWPGVALFSIFALLACVAGACDAAAVSDERERLEGVWANSVERSKQDAALTEKVEKLEKQVDHLQKKDALSALG